MVRRIPLGDGAVALMLTAIAVVEVLSAHGVVGLLLANPEATIGPLPLDLVLAALTTLPVALRTVRPGESLLAVFAVQILANLLLTHHFPFFGGLGSLALLLYSFGRHAPPRLARWGWGAPLAWAGTFPVRTPEARDPASVLYAVVLLTLPWIAGLVIRRLADQRRALDTALQKLSGLEAAHREAAVLTERTRIAQEMHDVLAHGVTVMVVQTGAARLELPDDSPARDALLTVEDTGRRVLGELRRTVGLLRSPGSADSAVPQPGLRDLPTLVASMREAGVLAELDLGPITRTDPARELVAYRVVQEALTNTLRHAGPTSALVSVSGDDELRVRVTDSGGRAPRAGEGGGFGLAGLRERVELYGGRFSAGPRGKGFEVTAVIPWEDSP